MSEGEVRVLKIPAKEGYGKSGECQIRKKQQQAHVILPSFANKVHEHTALSILHL